MKPFASRLRAAVLGAACLLLAGCLFKPTTVATRNFVLTPLPVPAGATAPENPLAVGVGLVRLPPHLLRTSIALRKGTNEVTYMEAALWADRLDVSLQRTLAMNLSVLLPSDRIRLSAWTSRDVDLAVYVNVQEFDVDAQGLGRLAAWWRITNPAGDRTLRSGETRLTRQGAPPVPNPEAVAATLSGLTAELSEVLARALRETAATLPVSK
jgi:uncharacterized lipoprotein YmbA